MSKQLKVEEKYLLEPLGLNASHSMKNMEMFAPFVNQSQLLFAMLHAYIYDVYSFHAF